MADEPLVIRGINWREALPFTNVFRAFRIAIHPSKLILALVAVLLLYFGGRALDRVWLTKFRLDNSALGDLARVTALSPIPSQEPTTTRREDTQGPFISFLQYEIINLNATVSAAPSLDVGNVYLGVTNVLVGGPRWLITTHWFFAILWFAWFLVVWSVFGGAIARIAAVHVARDEKMSVRAALRFSVSKGLSFLFAPLIPLGIVLAIAVLMALVGLVLLHIPYIGPILVGLFLFLALAGGFVMALVLLGTVGGLNLMYPTVAVEGSDSFDAISRSFSYVYARPWRLAFYTLVALIYGAIVYLFVKLFIFLVLYLSNTSVGWFLTGRPALYWNGQTQSITRTVKSNQETETFARDPRTGAPGAIWPAPNPAKLPYGVYFGGLKWSEKTAAGLSLFWVMLTISVLGAFAISFYFSANTIIYYLMRKEVDATEMDDVYVEEPEEEFAETMPGAAATATTTVSETVVTTTAPDTVVATPAPDATQPPPADANKPADTPPAT